MARCRQSRTTNRGQSPFRPSCRRNLENIERNLIPMDWFFRPRTPRRFGTETFAATRRTRTLVR